ncbi:MAG: TIGR00296 family protein [Thermoproteota archaeon]|nr:MAG: TIGR00296 family protein [Candidatus Korarchaeota archaeon]
MGIEDIDLEHGAYLVRLARRAIETYLLEGSKVKVEPPYEILKLNFGVFVTLNTYPEGELRGCIGYPEPILPLYRATVEAAIAAAVEDPRFPPLRVGELGSITVEVSVLSPPEKIVVESREKLPEEVVVGKHGLMVRSGWLGGLLLPQVAVEYGWNSRQFLDQTCVKAGMSPGCWLREDVDVYRFCARIFKEESPAGEVTEEIIWS